MENEILCDYGCGQKAIHQFKNGKWCCGTSIKKCPKISPKGKDSQFYGKFHTKESKDKLKNEIATVKKLNDNQTILCKYGCGQLAEFLIYKNEYPCCSYSKNKCPELRKKNKEKTEIINKDLNRRKNILI